jgi:hypothetical protein
MPKVSENALSEWTGKTRATIRKRLADMPYVEGPQRERLREAKDALERIYAPEDTDDGEQFVTTQEAQRRLTLAKGKQVELEMEVTTRTRIPIELVKQIMETGCTNIAGVIKAHRNKVFDEVAVGDCLAELRGVEQQLNEWTDSAIATLTPADFTPQAPSSGPQ